MRQASPHDALLEEFRHLKLDGTDTAELAHAIRLLGAMVELLHPPEYERPVVHPFDTATAQAIDREQAEARAMLGAETSLGST